MDFVSSLFIESTQNITAGKLTTNQNATAAHLSDKETPEDERKDVFGGK